MDVKLESLIEKIKKEGVQEAEAKAGQIIKEARDKGEKIVKQAQEEAKTVKEKGQQDAEKFSKNAEESLKQAARNLVLSVRERLTAIFENILKQELRAALGPDELAKILENIINKWSKEKEKGLEVLASEKDKGKIEKILVEKFKEKAKNKIEIKSSKSVKKGFQIGIQGQDCYYDFSDDGIIEALSVFLNPLISSLISGKKDG